MKSGNLAPATQLGTEIPYTNPHALSVSLPTWSDTVSYVAGEEAVVNVMSTGYPRFFVHRMILKLADLCLERLGITHKSWLLFPTQQVAQECLTYMQRHSPPTEDKELRSDTIYVPLDDSEQTQYGLDHLELHVVIFPPELKKLGKSFWQHTGMGISSRYAVACLSAISKNGMFLDKSCLSPSMSGSGMPTLHVLQLRIAELCASGHESQISNGAHPRSGDPLPLESDVYLYPSGMSAIWHAHQLTMSLKPNLKAVCFGFPYIDTNKILEKWGPGCIFYGNDPDANMDAFEAFLHTSQEPKHQGSINDMPSNSGPPISALFCECPSNPLLQSPNLPRLRRLADHYGFLIVIDDTIGNFVNVNVLRYVDIVTTSLSKLFSGNADVMGGSLVLNPRSRHYGSLKSILERSYANDCFYPDIVRMELNSRDFESRVHTIDANTRAVCHFLSCFAIKEVFYPEWVTRTNYDLSRRPGFPDNFGALFSLTFVSPRASEAFFNALPCAKGPSLGTNFTLACPYTILAHYWEREWAAGYGIEEGLVRVSVGMEEIPVLMEWFGKAVEAAEKVLSDRDG